MTAHAVERQRSTLTTVDGRRPPRGTARRPRRRRARRRRAGRRLPARRRNRSPRSTTSSRSPACRCWPGASSARPAMSMFVSSPLHKQRFDLRTGRCLDDESVSVRVWTVAVIDGYVCVVAVVRRCLAPMHGLRRERNVPMPETSSKRNRPETWPRDHWPARGIHDRCHRRPSSRRADEAARRARSGLSARSGDQDASGRRRGRVARRHRGAHRRAAGAGGVHDRARCTRLARSSRRHPLGRRPARSARGPPSSSPAGPKANGALVTAGFDVAWTAPRARYDDITDLLEAGTCRACASPSSSTVPGRPTCATRSRRWAPTSSGSRCTAGRCPPTTPTPSA